MGLPFKNGMELAQAMGFGKMYQVSKQKKENEVQMESRRMNRQLIRLTESDLHRIVKESVNRILNESVEDEVLACTDETSGEYQKGFQEGINDARHGDRNHLLDQAYFILRRYKKAFQDGYPVGEDQREQWHLGWINGVRQEFRESDAYDELQNQDYEPGWQFK